MSRPGRGQGSQSTAPDGQPAVQAAPGQATGTGQIGPGQPESAQDGAVQVDTVDAAAAASEPSALAGPSRPQVSAAPRWAGQLAPLTARPWARHVALLLCFIAAGIAVTWPRLSYLWQAKLPATPDVSSYVWALWWVPHQIGHLADPWFTTYMAAPVGVQLGFNTLMPLPAILFAPVTAGYGAAASFTVLTLLTPGLACYSMYRAARLWLNAPAAIAAGALFGLSSMLAWQNWYHINISLGTVFLPLTLEAAVRLRREPTIRRGIGLGLVLAASLLVNQESTVLAILLTIAVVAPWLIGLAIRHRTEIRAALGPLGAGALAAAVVASPQLVAMAQQAASGGASVPAGQLAANSTLYGVGLPTLFAPSPRLASHGLAHLASSFSYSSHDQLSEGLPTFGAVLTALALLGVLAAWRRRSTWGFAGLWLGSAALALGPFLLIGTHAYYPLRGHVHSAWVPLATVSGVLQPGHWVQVPVSNLMPYSWLMRVPGLSGLREADRFALLGLVGAALLAGLAVQWLTRHAKPAVAVPLIVLAAVPAAFEAGWSGTAGPGSRGTMPTTFPLLDAALARDTSRSIVVDIPYGLRGGLNLTGAPIPVKALVLATLDGHPRAISYTSWVPTPTINAVQAHPFYAQLIRAEANGVPTCAVLAANRRQHPAIPPGPCISAAQLTAAHADALRMHIGWIMEWRKIWVTRDPGLRYSNVDQFLAAAGFRRAFEHVPAADGVWFYRLKRR